MPSLDTHSAAHSPLAAATLLAAMALLAACGAERDAGAAADAAVALLPSPAGEGSGEPHLAQGPDGTVVLSWLEARGDSAALRYSVLQDDAWQPARTVAVGSNWFVNWADVPSVVPFANGRWAAQWLVKQPGGTYAYDVAIALSNDGGVTWSKPVSPHEDGTATEHGFVSLYETAGSVGALWLDGRNMEPDGHAHAPAAKSAVNGTAQLAGMTLRSTRLTSDLTLQDAQVVDDLVCDCCQTSVARTADGPVAVYRDRTVGDVRDIHVARNVAGRWQPGRAVAHDGWVITGCPVNGPAIDAAGKQVIVAWYTAANGEPRVRVARSTDAAESFGNPIDVHGQRPLGRVDVAILDNGDAAVSWLQTAAGSVDQAEIVVRRVTVDGQLGPTRVVARTSAKRPSGFPKMLKTAGQLLFAWTDTGANPPRVVTARMNNVAAL